MGLIGDLKNRVSTTLSNAVDAVEQKATDAVDAVKKEAVEAYNKADSFVSDTKKSLSEQYDTASKLYDSPNKGATISTNYEIDKLRLTQPLGSRLTPDIQKALADGVAVPRSTDTDRGARGILGKEQATRAAETITQMDGGDYETTKQLLAQAGQGADGKPAAGADAGAEKALILKAMAARSDRLKDPSQHEAAFKEVEDFAKDIRGMKRDELVRTTTATDVQGASNAESLKQAYENTCAPTVSQLTRAEIDPVYARDLATKGADKVDAEQKWLYDNTNDHVAGPNEADHVPRARIDPQAREKFSGVLLANLQAQQGPIPPPVAISPLETRALSDYAAGKTLTPAQAKLLPAAKNKLDQLGNSDANSAAVESLRSAARAQGVNEESALKLNGNLEMNPHAVAKGGEKEALKAMKERLEAGEPVPFSIEYEGQATGHALIATDYRSGKYLVADPYSGKTEWVNEADLRSGEFAQKTFQLGGKARIDGYYAP